MRTKSLLFTLLYCSPAFILAQSIINVPGDYQTIQEGIDAAMDDDVVLVDDGTYYENINFNGKAITVASLFWDDGDTNHINNTIIDGSQPANPNYGSVVTFSSGGDTTSVLCGFTITGGTGTNTFAGFRCGGGIYCNDAGAKIINNKVVNNTSEHAGDACGGGIGCRNGSWIVIRDNTISGNVVSANDLAIGGGIYSRDNSTIISNNVISNDSLSGYDTFGGAVSISYTYHTEMTENIITHNKVNNINWSMPGVYFYTPIGPVNIFRNEFSYNEATQGPAEGGGGGLRFDHAYDYPVMIDGNRFLHNTEDYGGGFLGQYSYNLKLTNNVFIGNNAIEGGAIRIRHEESGDDYRPQIINNTFVNNSANYYGGAISYMANAGANGSSPVVMNCIFWDNVANEGKDLDNFSNDTVYIFNSDIDTNDISWGPWSGQDNFLQDPELDADNIHLLEGSPGINAGTVGLVINGIVCAAPGHDIDGEARPLQGMFDIGADEIDIPQSIEEITGKDIAFSIYPNPASNKFTVELLKSGKATSLEIIDIQGKVVLHQEVTDDNFSMNVSNFPKGLYFVRINISGGVEVEKLVVQ